MRSQNRRSWAALAVLLLFAVVPGAFAQVASGNVYGTVTDESGSAIPGAAITLSGANGIRTATTGPGGDFHFLNLDPGSYKLEAALTGFAGANREVVVNTGANLTLAFSLKVASVQESITITAETPVIDAKKTGTATTLTHEELSQIPSGRDPWAILRTIPGVTVDRVNIAGNENGQQANFNAKGSAFTDTMWNLDGVVITDMYATGSSPTYWDYDAFDEVAVSTGGNDLKSATGGISLNFVTKRGTNSLHGSTHGYFTHDDLQSKNLPAELSGDPRLHGADVANHIRQIADYGLDLGGPIVKDKLWFYGSYGKQDIRVLRLNQTSDKTQLTSYNGKLNWQPSPDDSLSFFYFNGIKVKKGRSIIGATGTEDDSFLDNQNQSYQRTFPHGLLKLQYDHTFSPSLFASGKLTYYDGGGFQLIPRGAADQDGEIDLVDDVSHGSGLFAINPRPQYIANLDASYFKTALGGSHEFKFGFGYRKNTADSSSGWSGSKVLAIRVDLGIPGVDGIADVTRDKAATYSAQYTDGYLGDTYSRDRLTLKLGLRFDHQTAENGASNVPASPAFPELLPAVAFAGGGQGVHWNDLSPRAGASYALDESRKTLVRASFARYASQLNAGDTAFDSPVGANYSYLNYGWRDANHDGFAQRDEVLTNLFFGAGFVDPKNPGSPTSPNKIDPNYKASHDNELIVGLERELFTDFSASGAYTYRKSTDIAWEPRIGLTSADYTLVDTETAHGYTAIGYAPDEAKVDASGGGRVLTNRPDYSRSYSGFELSLTKRLSHRWFLRSALTLTDWKEQLGPGAVQNPTRTTNGAPGGAFERFNSGPQVDGGLYAPATGASGKANIFVSSKWQVVANALYQLPSGFEAGAALFGRQGNPFPVILNVDAGRDGSPLAVLAVPTLDAQRYKNLWNLDLRLAKNFKIAGSSKVTLSVEAFNVFNNDAVLQRTRTANSSAFQTISEVLNPRIVRFGLRYNF